MIIFPSTVEKINVYLFKSINAPAKINGTMLQLGDFFASNTIALFPLILLFNWFWFGEKQKKIILHALLSMILSFIINIIVSLIFQYPRPFMVPIGNNFLYHAPSSSFPSNHVSLACAISFSLITNKILRKQGILLCIISSLMAWARIYMGVHFPLDMVASLLIALTSTVLSFRCIKLVNRSYSYIYPVYYTLFFYAIERGIIK